MSSTRRIRVPASALSSKKSSTTYLKGSTLREEEQSSSVAIGDLLTKIESFAYHKDTFLSNLDSTKFNQLKSIKETASYLKDKKCYKLVINKIHETYDDNVKAGTVGAFFKGSFITESGGPCSKFSAGAIPRPPTPGWKECEKNVAILANDDIQVILNNPSSSEMIVHVSREEPFVGFNNSVLGKMKSMGIRRTTIVVDGETDWDKCTSADPESLSYSKFSSESECDARTKSHTKLPPSKKCHRKEPKKQCNDYSSFAIAVVAFILLLLIAGAFWWWNSKKAAVATTPTTVFSETTVTHFGGPGYVSV